MSTVLCINGFGLQWKLVEFRGLGRGCGYYKYCRYIADILQTYCGYIIDILQIAVDYGGKQ